MSKKCVKCSIEKPLQLFRKYENNDTFSSTCKQCSNEMDKLRKQNMRKKQLERFVNCEKCGLDKPLHNFAKLKKFYKKKICLTCYPLFLTEQKNEWCKNQRNTNMNYRIKKSLAARLRNVLIKNNTTMNYIGCNIQYLREWFEYNFTQEMNWDNYGTYWSIDHIIPVSYFNLTDELEKLKCWNWSNMVPVTVTYNSTKKHIDILQVDCVINKLEKFKEEGSTTKWFSEEFLLNKEFAIQKQNSS
jgi:hypothetical protein